MYFEYFLENLIIFQEIDHVYTYLLFCTHREATYFEYFLENLYCFRENSQRFNVTAIYNALTFLASRPEHSSRIMSLPWLLMPWLYASPVHQQPQVPQEFKCAKKLLCGWPLCQR